MILRSIGRRGGPATVWLRAVGAVTGLLVAFALLQGPVRAIEAHACAGLLQVLGFHGVALVSGSTVYLVPSHGPAFWVVLTPSCSSLAPVLTLACLALMLPRSPSGTRRAVVAYVAAAIAVVLGNFLRIDASIVAGLIDGESALVLFHDSVGTIFAFAYTLAGFVLMLWLQLPDRRQTRIAGLSDASKPAPAPALPAVEPS